MGCFQSSFPFPTHIHTKWTELHPFPLTHQPFISDHPHIWSFSRLPPAPTKQSAAALQTQTHLMFSLRHFYVVFCLSLCPHLLLLCFVFSLVYSSSFSLAPSLCDRSCWVQQKQRIKSGLWLHRSIFCLLSFILTLRPDTHRSVCCLAIGPGWCHQLPVASVNNLLEFAVFPVYSRYGVGGGGSAHTQLDTKVLTGLKMNFFGCVNFVSNQVFGENVLVNPKALDKRLLVCRIGLLRVLQTPKQLANEWLNR